MSDFRYSHPAPNVSLLPVKFNERTPVRQRPVELLLLEDIYATHDLANFVFLTLPRFFLLFQYEDRYQSLFIKEYAPKNNYMFLMRKLVINA
jgi:hypothetical protein